METNAITNRQTITEDDKVRFRLWLQRQFTERCKKNPKYSLRAFAKFVKMDASSLSQILSGKRDLSKKMIERLSSILTATPKDLKSFGMLPRGTDVDGDFYQVGVDSFAVISDWYHYAIMELTFVDGFQADAKWISRKLNITVEETKAAIERLKRLGLLVDENKSFLKTNRLITNHAQVNTSGAHKELQRQLLLKALNAIEECPQEDKDITSMTMAIDVAKLDEARSLIRRFRRDLCALLEDGEQSQVYNLGVQLFPLTDKSK